MLDVGADAAAPCEHLAHGDGARQVELVAGRGRVERLGDVQGLLVVQVGVPWHGHLHGQLQVLLLHGAVAEALAAVTQVALHHGCRGRRLEVEG